MAIIGIVASDYIPYRNYVTINDSDPVRVQNGYYKVDDGNYTVVVHSANGQAWECSGRIRSFGSCTECLSIRLALDQAGNIVSAQYAVLELRGTQEWAAKSLAQKLDLTFGYPKTDVSSITYNDIDDVLEEDEIESTSTVASAPSRQDSAPKTYTEPTQESAPVKKGGTGWIVFGVICLAAAFLTAEGIASVISCGVLGAASLLFGIHKKKG